VSIQTVPVHWFLCRRSPSRFSVNAQVAGHLPVEQHIWILDLSELFIKLILRMELPTVESNSLERDMPRHKRLHTRLVQFISALLNCLLPVGSFTAEHFDC